jgi:predicted small secreted protein
MKMLKRTVICLLLAAAAQFVFTGCHTANGFGQDMQDAGQSIQDKTSK